MGTNRTVIFMGLVLVIGGGLFLAGNLFNFNAWAFFWPAVLIGLGIWFITRTTSPMPGGTSTVRFIGDIHRSGPWQVGNEEISLFVGDIHLDLSQAVIQPGESHLRISGFVGDLSLTVPAGVGVSVSATAFISDVNFFGQRREAILSPVELSTPEYAAAERRLRVDAAYFVADAKFRQG